MLNTILIKQCRLILSESSNTPKQELAYASNPSEYFIQVTHTLFLDRIDWRITAYPLRLVYQPEIRDRQKCVRC